MNARRRSPARRLLVVALVATLAVACAHDVDARFPSEPGEEVGAVER